MINSTIFLRSLKLGQNNSDWLTYWPFYSWVLRLWSSPSWPRASCWPIRWSRESQWSDPKDFRRQWLPGSRTVTRSRPSCCRTKSWKSPGPFRRPETDRSRGGSRIRESFPAEDRPRILVELLSCSRSRLSGSAPTNTVFGNIDLITRRNNRNEIKRLRCTGSSD